MSQFAREHPEDYEERLEAMIDAADMERKRRKEEPDFYREEHQMAALADAATDAERQQEASEDAESKRLREIHLGDPAYDKLYSPSAIRRQEQRDREEDERYD